MRTDVRKTKNKYIWTNNIGCIINVIWCLIFRKNYLVKSFINCLANGISHFYTLPRGELFRLWFSVSLVKYFLYLWSPWRKLVSPVTIRYKYKHIVITFNPTTLKGLLKSALRKWLTWIFLVNVCYTHLLKCSATASSGVFSGKFPTSRYLVSRTISCYAT